MTKRGVSAISQPAAGMLVFAYLLIAVTFMWSTGPDTGEADPSARGALQAVLLYWPGLVGVGLAWGADVLMSKKGEALPGGRGITVGRVRLFHGPLVTGLFLLAGLLAALASTW